MARCIAIMALAGWIGFVACPAQAHDVTYELHGSGEARVAFLYQGGSPMAGATVEIFAPGGGALPDATRVTDASGEVDLQTGRDGVWRVEARDAMGHASRARVRVSQGVVSLAGQTIPEWLATASLLGNFVLAGFLALDRRRARARSSPSLRTQQGPFLT